MGGVREVDHESSLEPVAAEPPAADGREQRIARVAVALVEPDAQHGGGGPGERRDPLFSALPSYAGARVMPSCRCRERVRLLVRVWGADRLGINLGSSSEVVEEAEQVVARSVSAGFGVGGCGAVERSLFETQVSVEVAAGRVFLVRGRARARSPRC